MIFKQMLLPAALAALLLAGKGEASCNAHYTVVSGDSCSSIANTKHTYFAEVLALNPTTINSACTNLAVGQSVCWRDSTDPSCTTKSVVPSGGSCSSMAASYGTNLAEILGLNPYLKSDCSNLYAGDYICVSGTVPSTTTTTVLSTTTTASSTPTVACAKSYTVKSGDTCSTIESANSITDTVLHSLNPAINSACSNLAVGQSLCLQASTATTTTASSTATPSGCAKAYTVKSGDTCSSIETANSISDSLFHSLNPAINSGCSNLAIGQMLCIQAVPTSTTTSSSTATPSGCSKTYTVKSGDTCSSMAAQYNTTLFGLNATNPGLDCQNLMVDQQICVQPPSVACSQAYYVNSNMTCKGIASASNITVDQFNFYNPTYNCSNVVIGSVVCTGIRRINTVNLQLMSSIIPHAATLNSSLQTEYYAYLANSTAQNLNQLNKDLTAVLASSKGATLISSLNANNSYFSAYESRNAKYRSLFCNQTSHKTATSAANTCFCGSSLSNPFLHCTALYIMELQQYFSSDQVGTSTQSASAKVNGR